MAGVRRAMGRVDGGGAAIPFGTQGMSAGHGHVKGTTGSRGRTAGGGKRAGVVRGRSRYPQTRRPCMECKRRSGPNPASGRPRPSGRLHDRGGACPATPSAQATMIGIAGRQRPRYAGSGVESQSPRSIPRGGCPTSTIGPLESDPSPITPSPPACVPRRRAASIGAVGLRPLPLADGRPRRPRSRLRTRWSGPTRHGLTSSLHITRSMPRDRDMAEREVRASRGSTCRCPGGRAGREGAPGDAVAGGGGAVRGTVSRRESVRDDRLAGAGCQLLRAAQRVEVRPRGRPEG